MTALIVLFLFGVVGWRLTSPEERARTITRLKEFVSPVLAEAARGRAAMAPFREVLRARTRWAVVTPAIGAISVFVYLQMLLGKGSFGDPGTLVAWGANFGPETTNGEWWRLLTATFVHAGLIHLLADLIGLLKAGFLLERLVGSGAFALVYVTAALFASLVGLSEHPLAVHVGASGAIFGIYGLLLAVTSWSFFRPGTLRIPWMAYQSIIPTAVVFFLYNFATEGLANGPNLRGFVVGAIAGFALTFDISERKPALRPLAIVIPVAALICIWTARPFRGLVDVRPEIARVVAIEDHTAAPYLKAVDRMTAGRGNVNLLTAMIDDKIMPELKEARTRIESLDGVHKEHQPFVADAEEYLRLRETSWRLRAEGLRKAHTPTLREANKTEQASLRALERLKSMRLTPHVVA